MKKLQPKRWTAPWLTVSWWLKANPEAELQVSSNLDSTPQTHNLCCLDPPQHKQVITTVLPACRQGKPCEATTVASCVAQTCLMSSMTSCFGPLSPAMKQSHLSNQALHCDPACMQLPLHYHLTAPWLCTVTVHPCKGCSLPQVPCPSSGSRFLLSILHSRCHFATEHANYTSIVYTGCWWSLRERI